MELKSGARASVRYIFAPASFAGASVALAEGMNNGVSTPTHDTGQPHRWSIRKALGIRALYCNGHRGIGGRNLTAFKKPSLILAK